MNRPQLFLAILMSSVLSFSIGRCTAPEKVVIKSSFNAIKDDVKDKVKESIFKKLWD